MKSDFPTLGRRTLHSLKGISLVGFVSIAFVFFCTFTVPASRGNEFPTGKIVDNVACETDAHQSYALYLPTNYDPGRRWPVLYCFDPSARGKFPVERFKEAAEKYGYIVVGSNNSRNGLSGTELQQVIQTMWTDSHARFSIDSRRVYAAGFSGGARVANSLASVCNGCVTGVVACGAGFPAGTTTKALPYVIFATVGTDDFNYSEMTLLDKTLTTVANTHHLEIFSGGHQWAPSELCEKAIAWMEIQAMRSKLRLPDEKLIVELFNRGLNLIRIAEESGSVYDAYRGYEALTTDFRGLKGVEPYERKLATLADSDELKKALKEEAKQIQEEGDLFTRINIVDAMLNPDNRELALVRLRADLARLKSSADKPLDSGDRRLARRTLNRLFAQAYESALFQYLPLAKYSLASVNLELAAEVRPRDPEIWYQLARVYALTREKKKALEALSTSVDCGFSDAARIEKDQSLDPLRDEAVYKRVVQQIANKRKP